MFSKGHDLNLKSLHFETKDNLTVVSGEGKTEVDILKRWSLARRFPKLRLDCSSIFWHPVNFVPQFFLLKERCSLRTADLSPVVAPKKPDALAGLER